MTRRFGQPRFITKPFFLFVFAFTASAIHAGPARAAPLKRMQCPFALKDKGGKTAGGICFDGKN